MRVGGELDSSLGPNNSLGDLAPTGITEVALPDGEVLDGGKDYNQKEMRAIPESVARQRPLDPAQQRGRRHRRAGPDRQRRRLGQDGNHRQQR